MLKYFNNLQNLTTNGNETKSDVFSWDIFISDIVFHQSQNTKIFLYLPGLKLLEKQAQISKET